MSRGAPSTKIDPVIVTPTIAGQEMGGAPGLAAVRRLPSRKAANLRKREARHD
jgi:hypothetical protein